MTETQRNQKNINHMILRVILLLVTLSKANLPWQSLFCVIIRATFPLVVGSWCSKWKWLKKIILILTLPRFSLLPVDRQDKIMTKRQNIKKNTLLEQRKFYTSVPVTPTTFSMSGMLHSPAVAADRKSRVSQVTIALWSLSVKISSLLAKKDPVVH